MVSKQPCLIVFARVVLKRLLLASPKTAFFRTTPSKMIVNTLRTTDTPGFEPFTTCIPRYAMAVELK